MLKQSASSRIHALSRDYAATRIQARQRARRVRDAYLLTRLGNRVQKHYSSVSKGPLAEASAQLGAVRDRELACAASPILECEMLGALVQVKRLKGTLWKQDVTAPLPVALTAAQSAPPRLLNAASRRPRLH